MKQPDTKPMHPSDQITLIISRIYRSEMTTTSGGNISIRDKEVEELRVECGLCKIPSNHRINFTLQGL